MSETETSVPMDDKALFAAATADEAPEVAATETTQTETTQDSPARDEQGRFATKEAETTEQQPATTQQAPAQNADVIPPWRLREEAEARRASDARAERLERELHQLSGQLKQFTDKPAEAIDPFSDPEKFADQRARQALDPVKSQVDTIREHYSRKDAIRTHGAETVQEAYKWLDQSLRSRDPNAAALYQRVKESIDPFEDIVTAYKRDKAISTVGDDPSKWFEQELERRMADPAFKTKMQGQSAQGSEQTNIVKLPPSLNRQPGSAGNTGQASIDDKSLYAYATS